MSNLRKAYSTAVSFYRRRFVVLSVVLLLLGGLAVYTIFYQSLTPDADPAANITDLVSDGFRLIEEHEKNVKLENFKDVRFVPVREREASSPSSSFESSVFDLKFYLTNKNGDIIYQLPDYTANKRWIFGELSDVIFQDVNGDGKTDIIILAEFMFGAGDRAGWYFPTVTIFFQKGDGFINLEILDRKIHSEVQEKNIETILEYVQKNNEEINKELNNYT